MWAHLLAALTGVWLMAAPAVLDYAGQPADQARIVGPLVAAFGTIAVWEATRGCRWVNVLLGVWLMISPLVIDHPRPAIANTLVAGLLILGHSLVAGRCHEQFGGDWRVLFVSRETLNRANGRHLDRARPT